jgi:hypothetical protein
MELTHNYRIVLRSLRLVLRLFDLGTPQRRHCYDIARDVPEEGGIPGLFDDFPTIWALLLLTYWLPIWFQVVKSEGPEMSVAMILPTLIPQALISTISGKLVSTIGYYTLFALGGSMLTAIGWH